MIDRKWNYRVNEQARKLKKEYEEYRQRHSGQAYRCLTFEEWKNEKLIK